jgi:hypothetical protein
MSTGDQEQPSLREHVDDARSFLSAVAGNLTARGIKARVSSDGGIVAVLDVISPGHHRFRPAVSPWPSPC